MVENSRATRNHLSYSSYLVTLLENNRELSWNDAAQALVEKFGWTFKTASNRIHELACENVVKVVGEYRKGTFGRVDPDGRSITLP
jgi:hypothetical protein